jgi:1-acyl-sn-glycerol-3-phosphate acyltransferase
MNKFFKLLFFGLFVKPLIYIVIGINVRNPDRLPKFGPAILVANHTSHIDTLILMSLFSLKTVLSIYPIAAKDYFLKTKFGSWFFTNIIEIIPISREKEQFSHHHPFESATKKLQEGNIVIIYPEGTRGQDDKIGEFKRGVAHLAKLNPDVPIIPIYMRNPDKVLPKGEGLLVPFICDVYIGEKLNWRGSVENFTQMLKENVEKLKM